MIEDKIMDQILPVPDREEAKNKLRDELTQEGFVITNLFNGGVFYTLMMIAIQVRIDLVQLLRKVLNNQYLHHAEEGWLELKAADFSKRRKQPIKTRGFVTLKRKDTGKAVKIAKGDVFKTEPDMLGEELRYMVLENTIMPATALTFRVPVEAEKTGSAHNVPPGQIRKSLIHIEGIDEITNDADWISQEGSDLEDIESLRERTLNSWAELSTLPIAAKYKNVCEAIPGVLFVRVDDLHPRGQGTIDIIVTGTAGTPSESLLQKVRDAAATIKGPDDNLLVKASDTVTQDIDLTIWIPTDASDEGLENRAKAILTELLRIKKGRNLNELNHADIIFAIRRDIPESRNVRVTNPPQDVQLDNNKVIVLGEVRVTLMRG
ncbi:baseplate J/gp47 family protein [Paenibacillus alvei]|uniref:Baseplate J/gp47 family protein n=1 Tax=Paenibacillus alvei TaxID=44250 RepID=A0ABT4GZH9_PAEAL|nr:baseplate J/gp47 family protein [Paenibacillus alvei]MCY9762127.1 baseplate J/gp47 family protein [Paenibacillus alvei]MCY9771259.1 baseplate J/gp47 family protein [Paenibacillus alvei]